MCAALVGSIFEHRVLAAEALTQYVQVAEPFPELRDRAPRARDARGFALKSQERTRARSD